MFLNHTNQINLKNYRQKMGKPAATISCFHVCPKVTSKVPHVGGPIVAGTYDKQPQQLGKLENAEIGAIKRIILG
jgi:hypothetical protein